MDLTKISALVLVFGLGFAILFELAVVLGAPLGDFTAGGKYPGRLPAKARAFRFFYIGGWSLLLGHYLAQTGVLTPLLDSSLNQVVNWILASAIALGIYANSRSLAKKERALWMPLSLVMLVCALLVALQ